MSSNPRPLLRLKRTSLRLLLKGPHRFPWSRARWLLRETLRQALRRLPKWMPGSLRVK